MRQVVALGVLALLTVPGCDVAVVTGYVISNGDDDDDAVVAAPLAADLAYHVWIANIPSGTETTQRDTIVAAGGNPDATWTEVGLGTGTAVFDPAAPAASFNAILIQVGDAQQYRVDSIEVMNTADVVVATATGTTYFDLVTDDLQLLATADGLTADAQGNSTNKAFIFTIYTGPIEKFRVNAWGAARAPGDVEWVSGWADPLNEYAGGAAVNAAGTVLVAVAEAAGAGRDIRLLRFSSAGVLTLPTTLVQGGVTSTAGLPAVAFNAATGEIYVATTAGAGDILVRKYNAALAVQWSQTISSGSGDRTEHNSIIVDSNGNAIACGGLGGGTNVEHWVAKFNIASPGSTLWQQTSGSLDNTVSHWYAVAARPMTTEVAVGGDRENSGSNSSDTYVRKLTQGPPGPAVSTAWSRQLGDDLAPDDRIQAVAFDSSGNVIVAGFFGSPTPGMNNDALLMKYTSTGLLSQLDTYAGIANGNDEILDIALDTDGSVYAVGYETVTGQGENVWVRKYDASFTPVWTRTYHGGVGDDRAVSVVLTGGSVVVVGQETVAGGTTNVHVRRYAK